MESLDGTQWDVLIAGTGLKQSLLALALSRSDKKVLHVDSNDYYGGHQAALSLSEAEAWAQKHKASRDDTLPFSFTDAVVNRPENGDDQQPVSLGSSRAYSLALAPELIFTRSNILSALVSSKVHSQLEFQAVGSWFVLEEHDAGDKKLVRVPNGREDIFQDTALDLRTKRSLMKFIRFITDAESQESLTAEERGLPTPKFLQQKFGLARASQTPVHTLTLSTKPPEQTTVGDALPNIVRHLQSIGLFGAGFNALAPKWGGLAEIAQIACRAGAVGGGVYVLNRGVKSVDKEADDLLPVHLTQDEVVRARWLVGSSEEILTASTARVTQTWSRCICITSSPLTRLFPPTSEGGVTPAGAVIKTTSAGGHPVYIFAHSADTGECPSGQCILYASIVCEPHEGYEHLKTSVEAFLSTFKDDEIPPKLLWTLSYQQHDLAWSNQDTLVEKIVLLEDLGPGLALEDKVFDEVREVWHTITGGNIDDFMQFEARSGMEEEGEEDNEEMQP